MNNLNFDNAQQFANVLEALLLAAAKPLSVGRIAELFDENARPNASQIKAGLERLCADISERSYQLTEVASGFRLQVRAEYSSWVGRLSEERPQRYSRAMLETLALIAYRQPITRGEIEDVRGVAVNTHIIKTLLEREWIRVVGYKDVPGKPAMLATTKTFLDYFNLCSLDQLPNLSELQERQPAIDELKAPIAAVTVAATYASGTDELDSTVNNASQVSFSTLLGELESMEHGLITDFSDLVVTDSGIDADLAKNAVDIEIAQPVRAKD